MCTSSDALMLINKRTDVTVLEKICICKLVQAHVWACMCTADKHPCTILELFKLPSCSHDCSSTELLEWPSNEGAMRQHRKGQS